MKQLEHLDYFEYEKIKRENPEKIKEIYTKEEIEIILNRFKNNKVFICAFLTACYTGLRTGEVFALTWNDIDLDNRIIKINRDTNFDATILEEK